MEMKGFLGKFIQWTREVVTRGKVCVMINDVLGKYFTTKKGSGKVTLFRHCFLT
jgi:hypothetical protein